MMTVKGPERVTAGSGAPGGTWPLLGSGARLARACPGGLETPAKAALTAAQRAELERDRALGALLEQGHAAPPRPCHAPAGQRAAAAARHNKATRNRAGRTSTSRIPPSLPRSSARRRLRGHLFDIEKYHRFTGLLLRYLPRTWACGSSTWHLDENGLSHGCLFAVPTAQTDDTYHRGCFVESNIPNRWRDEFIITRPEHLSSWHNDRQIKIEPH